MNRSLSNNLNALLINIIGLLIPSSAFAVDIRPIIDSLVYTKAQNMVQVEPGRRLNLYCSGEGSPTVVFESGLGFPMLAWGYIQPAIADTVRTCSYDRAGIGFSDGASRPSTAAHIVDDLHRLLVAANIKPPYVLVGHSFGGMAIRLYTDKYPSEVVAMVLIDPAVEEQTESFRKINPKHPTVQQWRAEQIEPDLQKGRECVDAAKIGILEGSKVFEKCTFDKLPQVSDAINTVLRLNEAKLANLQAGLSEDENVHYTSSDQVLASRRSYGDMPLIVLTRGQWSPRKANATPADVAYHEQVHSCTTCS